MGTAIHILSEDLINKIAAGEVVERPASVIKELVENSIDAKATSIAVEIQSSGKKLMRVSDNANGIGKDDLKICCYRHATSKISSLDDLYNILTLGFRGEALSSIAAVSKLEIRSKQAHDHTGNILKIEGGNITNFETCGCPNGTTVLVKDIFYNTPARKKFLKSPATETGHIGDIVSKYALANPGIAFEFISDGKTLLQTHGTGSLRDAIIAIYGIELANQLKTHEEKTSFGRVFGFISQPAFTRVDKSYEMFFVNQRYIKHFLLNRALEESYRTLIPNLRYPVAILFIDIDPKLIDVNVHPAKKEIKFQDNNLVMDAIRSFVRTALGQNKEVHLRELPCQSHMTHDPKHLTEIMFNATLEPQENPFFEAEETCDHPRPIYQFKNIYIVAADHDNLYFIDQHAAHERILYDKISSNLSKASSQALLIAETIELSSQEKSCLLENLDYLKQLGFELEEFGANTTKISAVPGIAARVSAKSLLHDILIDLLSSEKSVQLDIRLENIRKTIACKSAIKAGDALSFSEMAQLIKDLFLTQNPHTCPHGRPTIYKVGQEALAKQFLRH